MLLVTWLYFNNVISAQLGLRSHSGKRDRFQFYFMGSFACVLIFSRWSLLYTMPGFWFLCCRYGAVVPKNSGWCEWIIWTTWKRHQRSIDSCSCRTRSWWCWKTNTRSSSQAWWARSDRPRETAETEYEHSTQITNKLTVKIYTQKLDLDYNPSDQHFTRHTKNRIRQEKMKNAKTSVMNFWRKWPLSHNN